MIQNGLLQFKLIILSAMDTNQPGPSGTSDPVTPSHGLSDTVQQKNSVNVVKMESPFAEDIVSFEHTVNNHSFLFQKHD